MLLLGQIRPEERSSVGQPSYGKLYPGYRGLRSRVRIPRGHRLVSVVDVQYSNSLEGIVEEGFPPSFFAWIYSYYEIAMCEVWPSLMAQCQQFSSRFLW